MKTLNYYVMHVTFFIWYGLLNAFLLFNTGSFLYVMLVWNVLLAFVPLLLADVTRYCYRVGKRLWMATLFVWFIFLPNSYYMMTDFIHLSGDTFFIIDASGYSQTYTVDLVVWLKLVSIALGVVYATFSGIRSFYLIKKNIIDQCGMASSLLFSLIVFLSNGVAIYIGRFLRLNSWNIFELAGLWQHWQNVGHGWGFTLRFIVMISIYVAVVTWLYSLFNSFKEE